MPWSTHFAQSNTLGGWIPLGVAALVVLTLVVTFLVAFVIWRDGYNRGWRKARNMPPTCGDCGYNMSGLSQCRCPECGKECTLDELWRISIYSPRRREEASADSTQEGKGST